MHILHLLTVKFLFITSQCKHIQKSVSYRPQSMSFEDVNVYGILKPSFNCGIRRDVEKRIKRERDRE